MRIVTIWRALVGIGSRLRPDPLRMMDLGRGLPETSEGASLLTGPFDLYNRTNKAASHGRRRAAISDHIIVPPPISRQFRLAWPLRHGTPMVRLTKGRPRTPCCRATRPKNLGYGERSRAGNSVRGHKADQGERCSCLFAVTCCWPQAPSPGCWRSRRRHAQQGTVKIGLIMPYSGRQFAPTPRRRWTTPSSST